MKIEIVQVDPAPGFKYYYQLFVDGHPFEQFTEHQARVLKTWLVRADDDGKEYRIVLGKWVHVRYPYQCTFKIN